MVEKVYTETEVKNLINEIELIKTGLQSSRKLAKTAYMTVNSTALQLTPNLLELKAALAEFDSRIEELGE